MLLFGNFKWKIVPEDTMRIQITCANSTASTHLIHETITTTMNSNQTMDDYVFVKKTQIIHRINDQMNGTKWKVFGVRLPPLVPL